MSILIGAVFLNQFKAPQGCSFEACCQWTLLDVQIMSPYVVMNSHMRRSGSLLMPRRFTPNF